MYGPNPNEKEPIRGFPQVSYLKNFITKGYIIGGENHQKTFKIALCDWLAQKII
jgi:hypothetical protein